MPWESLKKERNAYVVFTCAGSSYVVEINPLSLHNRMTWDWEIKINLRHIFLFKDMVQHDRGKGGYKCIFGL